MNSKATLLAMILAAVPFANTQAYAGNVTSMSITGGSFTLGGSPGTPNPWSGFAVANIIGGDQAFGSPFSYFGKTVSIFNSDEGATNTYAPYGAIPVSGGDPNSISATISGNTITADLTGWTWNWGGTNVNSGSVVTGTVDAAGNYSLSWSSTMVGGQFNGETADWSISGVAAVPEPSTYGMMTIGLALVGVAVVRRRKSY